MAEEAAQEEKLPKIGDAKAAPTKNFFVNMLTRDIELQDSLLDLLDNCVDGILRSIGEVQGDTPYAGYKATMTFDAEYFIIEDNCGGIPKSVAEKYAFSMGRPPDEDVEQLAAAATVGMYGIGMKRAIFKLGTDAHVESRHDEGFTVEFSPEWMSDRGWTDLPMFPLKEGELADGGTRITVYQLHEECKKAFAEKTWIESFRNSISRHYAIIISKGFEVRVGTEAEIAAGAEPIAGAEFRLLETDALPDGSRVQPFTYFGTLDGVEVEIYAGLYRKLLTEEEADREEQTRGVKDDAGWTVACNDRVVIWKDTTRLTGWGEATVPNYHGQFIAITGLVLLHSDDPAKLPLTTTKRGIDAASNVYAEVKDLMREATKNLTSFTYKWKKHERELDSIYQNSRYVELPTLRTMAQEVSTGQVRKFATMKRSEVKLPAPVNENRTARVSFTADKDDIAKLKKHYFDDQPVATSEVGEAAFNDALSRIKK